MRLHKKEEREGATHLRWPHLRDIDLWLPKKRPRKRSFAKEGGIDGETPERGAGGGGEIAILPAFPRPKRETHS